MDGNAEAKTTSDEHIQVDVKDVKDVGIEPGEIAQVSVHEGPKGNELIRVSLDGTIVPPPGKSLMEAIEASIVMAPGYAPIFRAIRRLVETHPDPLSITRPLGYVPPAQAPAPTPAAPKAA